MSPRPKRKRRSHGARVRPFWLLLIVVAAAAVFGGYYAATWQGFYPQSIAVTGNRVVPRSEIVRRARIRPDSNLWLQNMHAASTRIAAIPYVKDVHIGRSLPARVRITVTERTPFAVVRTGKASLLVDSDLRVLQPATHPGVLPVFIVPLSTTPAPGTYLKASAAHRLLDDYQELLQAHVIVGSLAYDKFGDLVAGMRDGVRLLLGDDTDLAKKTALIGPILSQVAAGGRRIAAVDLRASDTPVVVYK